MIPPTWTRLIIEYEGYSNRWIAWAIAPRADGEPYWFKATGADAESAFTALKAAVAADEHIKQVPKVTWAKRAFHSTPTNLGDLAGKIKISL